MKPTPTSTSPCSLLRQQSRRLLLGEAPASRWLSCNVYKALSVSQERWHRAGSVAAAVTRPETLLRQGPHALLLAARGLPEARHRHPRRVLSGMRR